MEKVKENELDMLYRKNRNNGININSLENDELIVEENTIYEIDLNCYECMMKEKYCRRL